ncbi:MAG: hypothetical protein ABL999_08175 [Pyrinomonadaceae bacterium]
MNEPEARQLAERIAEFTAESRSPDLAAIQKSLDVVNERLDRLESSPSITNFRSQISNPIHPSQDHFGIAEAIVEGLFAQKKKACTFEPSKSCDHCSMCNSRGF